MEISEKGENQVIKENPILPEPSTVKGEVDSFLFPKVSRWKKWGADSLKVFFAIAFFVFGIFVWFQPPMYQADTPVVRYTFQGRTFSDAILYRPLSVPTRFYVKLPHELARRYLWFSIDLRREVVALAEEPTRRFFQFYAIRRGDPLGLDLEFTKIDGLEWRVDFQPQSIIFSNKILSVRLDAGRREGKR